MKIHTDVLRKRLAGNELENKLNRSVISPAKASDYLSKPNASKEIRKIENN